MNFFNIVIFFFLTLNSKSHNILFFILNYLIPFYAYKEFIKYFIHISFNLFIILDFYYLTINSTIFNELYSVSY